MTTMNSLTSCLAYLSKLPSAVSGAGGHPSTFRAACECVRFGLSDADALTLLREWNGTHCRPPWTEKELAHKLADARRTAGGNARTFRKPAQAVRVVWKIERKAAIRPAGEPVNRNLPISESVEEEPRPTNKVALPHFTKGGDLSVPFATPRRFHYWKKRDDGDDILSLEEVRFFAVNASLDTCEKEA